jgi:hypothetical protein
MPHIAPLARTRTLASQVSEDGGASGAFRPQLEVKKRLTQQEPHLERWPSLKNGLRTYPMIIQIAI